MKKKEDWEKCKKEREKRQFTTKLKYQVHPTKKALHSQLWKWARESHWTKVASEVIQEIGKPTWRWVKGERTEEKPEKANGCVSQLTKSNTVKNLVFPRISPFHSRGEQDTSLTWETTLDAPLSTPGSCLPAAIAQECGPLHSSDLHPQRQLQSFSLFKEFTPKMHNALFHTHR